MDWKLISNGLWGLWDIKIVSSITSVHQRTWPDPVVPIISEIKWNVMEKQDNEDYKWRQGATWGQ